MSSAFVVLAAGGTGGHVFPAEALAETLINNQVRIALITDRRGNAYSGTLGSLETFRILAGGIAGKGLVTKVRALSEIALGTGQALALLKQLKPDVVVGFGGYASFPTVLAALLLKIPTILHEQNAVLGRANRLLARWASQIATSFAQVTHVPGSAQSRVTLTGMPVRPAIIALSAQPYVPPDEYGPIRLLVLGGSQGARILSQVIPEAIARLPQNLQSRLEISQQCRPEDLDSVKNAYAEANIKATLSSFFNDIPERLSQSHLVITRSGSSTVAELTAMGRPAILVPYQHAIDDHQTANARALAAAGGAWCMAQSDFTPSILATQLTTLLSQSTDLAVAAHKSRSFGRIDAAQRLAHLISPYLKALS